MGYRAIVFVVGVAGYVECVPSQPYRRLELCHTVKPGETPESLAVRLLRGKHDIPKLLKAARLPTDSRSLPAGTTFCISGLKAELPREGFGVESYKVLQGETLGKISTKLYGSQYFRDRLMNMNPWIQDADRLVENRTILYFPADAFDLRLDYASSEEISESTQLLKKAKNISGGTRDSEDQKRNLLEQALFKDPRNVEAASELYRMTLESQVPSLMKTDKHLSGEEEETPIDPRDAHLFEEVP